MLKELLIQLIQDFGVFRKETNQRLDEFTPKVEENHNMIQDLKEMVLDLKPKVEENHKMVLDLKEMVLDLKPKVEENHKMVLDLKEMVLVLKPKVEENHKMVLDLKEMVLDLKPKVEESHLWIGALLEGKDFQKAEMDNMNHKVAAIEGVLKGFADNLEIVRKA